MTTKLKLHQNGFEIVLQQQKPFFVISHVGQKNQSKNIFYLSYNKIPFIGREKVP